MIKSELLKFLQKVDKDFTPFFSQKTDLDSFCEKIMAKAKLFISYTDEGEIKGMVAIYANDFEHHYSYIPLLAVDKNFRNQGVARKSLLQAIDYVKYLGNDKISCIGIHTNNPVALHLYEELGFCLKDEPQNRKYLELSL